jgi:hypothetical protein
MKSKFYLCDKQPTSHYQPQAVGIVSSNPSLKFFLSLTEKRAIMELRKFKNNHSISINSEIEYGAAVDMLLNEPVLFYNRYAVTHSSTNWIIKDFDDFSIAHTKIQSNLYENVYNAHLKSIRTKVSPEMFEVCKRFCDVFELEKTLFSVISPDEILIQVLPTKHSPYVYIVLTPTECGCSLDSFCPPKMERHDGSFSNIYLSYCTKYNAIDFPDWIKKDITGYKVFSDAELIKKYGKKLTFAEIDKRVSVITEVYD